MFLCTRLLPAARRPIRASLTGSSIKSLQDAFRDPLSPFHTPPGSTGPASPDELPAGLCETEQPPPTTSAARNEQTDPAAQARAKLTSLGYDAGSLWEQSIVWGHHDAFRHVNNVHYCKPSLYRGKGDIYPKPVRQCGFLNLMQWAIGIGNLLGGQERAQAMLAGQGVSIILKSINVNYKRPVTFPDTLLIGHKAIVSSSRTQFVLAAAAYSYAQQTIVADSEGVFVWYDYDSLKKCDPGDEAWRVLRDGMGSEFRE